MTTLEILCPDLNTSGRNITFIYLTIVLLIMFENGEIKRSKGMHGTDTIAKREIGGNTYIIIVAPMDDHLVDYRVATYADKVSGEDFGIPESAAGYKVRNYGYDLLVSDDVMYNENLARKSSKILNKAISELTEELESMKSQEDAVIGALDANEEVHD